MNRVMQDTSTLRYYPDPIVRSFTNRIWEFYSGKRIISMVAKGNPDQRPSNNVDHHAGKIVSREPAKDVAPETTERYYHGILQTWYQLCFLISLPLSFLILQILRYYLFVKLRFQSPKSRRGEEQSKQSSVSGMEKFIDGEKDFGLSQVNRFGVPGKRQKTREKRIIVFRRSLKLGDKVVRGRRDSDFKTIQGSRQGTTTADVLKFLCVLYTVLSLFPAATCQDADPNTRKLSFEEGRNMSIIVQNFTFHSKAQLILGDFGNQNVFVGANGSIFMMNKDLTLTHQINTTHHTGVNDFEDVLTCTTERSLITCDWMNTRHCYMYRRYWNEARFFVVLPEMWKSQYHVFTVRAKAQTSTTKEIKLSSQQSEGFNKSVPMFYGCHPSNDNKTFSTERDRVSMNGYENIAFFHDTFLRNISGTGLLKFEHGGLPSYLWTANSETHLTRLHYNSLSNTDYKLQCINEGVNYTLAVAAGVQLSGTGNGSEKNLLVIFKHISKQASSVMCSFKIRDFVQDERQVKDYISVDLPDGTVQYTFWLKKTPASFEIFLNHFVDDRRSHSVAPISGDFQYSLKSVASSMALRTLGNRVFAYIGTEKGSIEVLANVGNGSPWRHVYELPLTKEAEISPSPSLSVSRSYTFDDKNRNLYLLTGKQVVKLSLEHCLLYQTCKTCIENRNVDCAWCERRCTPRDNCAGKTQYQTCTHQIPILHEMSPEFGPMSGGTELVLRGDHLLELTAVYLGGASCKITPITSTLINCTSTELKRKVLHGEKVTVNITATDGIDDHDLLKKFEYRPDPKIHSTSRKSSIYSGGTEIKVTGVHLNSVADPSMKISIWETHVLVKPIKKSEKSMVFLAPSMEDLNYQRPTTNNHTVANVSFVMDGVVQDFSQLLYYPDPIIHPFTNGTRNNMDVQNRTITLQGENLNFTLTKEDFVVLLNSTFECTVNSLTVDTLSCSISEEESRRMMSENSEYPVQVYVEVRVGNLFIFVGFVQFGAQNESQRSNKTVLLTSIPPAIIILIILNSYAYAKLRARFSSSSRDKTRKRASSVYEMEKGINGEADLIMFEDEVFEAPEKEPNLEEKQKILLPIKCLQMQEKIGQGRFGIVHKADFDMPGASASKQVAVKSLHIKQCDDNDQSLYQDCSWNEQKLEAFVEDRQKMTQLQHQNVLTLIGFCLGNEGQPMFVMPLMLNGNLKSYIEVGKHDEICTLVRLVDFAKQVAEGMAYLAKNNFTHSNLAARNCMLDENITVKISDFGLFGDAYGMNYYSVAKMRMLAIKWMAPESIANGINNTRSDVWSYGIVLWEIMSRGTPLYHGMEDWDVLDYLKNGKRLEKPLDCPDEMYTIELSCWQYEPCKRPTFYDLVKSVQEVSQLIKKETSV